MYHQSIERSIEEERPRLQAASSSSQNNQISLANPPYTPYDPSENDVGDKRDYMTHIQGKISLIKYLYLCKLFMNRMLILKILLLNEF